MGMARQSTSRGLYLAYRIFSTMTDNTDTYDFATFDKEATLYTFTEKSLAF